MRHFFWSLPLCLLAGCALSVEHPPAADSSAVLTATFESPEDQEKAPKADATRKLLDNDGMVRLAKTDPIAFLEDTIRRYDRKVRGYTCTLIKEERVGGKVQPRERIACKFREKPFSVLMDWKEGIGLAKKTLYVAGENDGKLLAMPAGWRRIAGIQSRDVKSADAMKTSRFPITEFGLKKGVVAALVPWKNAKKRGDLKVIYGGLKRLPELNKRPCWEMKRVGYPKPEDDGVTEATFYFDMENWLMIGTVLRGEEGQLIAKYYFNDVELNPEFDEDTFTRKALTN
jgi:hypothetical protein